MKPTLTFEIYRLIIENIEPIWMLFKANIAFISISGIPIDRDEMAFLCESSMISDRSRYICYGRLTDETPKRFMPFYKSYDGKLRDSIIALNPKKNDGFVFDSNNSKMLIGDALYIRHRVIDISEVIERALPEKMEYFKTLIANGKD